MQISKPAEKADALYGEAEQQLQKYATSNGKFAPSAERMLNLIRYRLHPNERVGELARILSGFGNNDNFRQNVIDYNWLLDKFETGALAAEAKRKAEAERVKGTTEDEIIGRNIIDATAQITDANIEVTVANGEVTLTGNVPKESLARILQAAAEAKPKKINNQLTAVGTTAEEEREGFLKIVFYSADFVAGPRAFSTEIHVYLATGMGTLMSPVTIPIPSVGKIAVGDFTADGKPDLVFLPTEVGHTLPTRHLRVYPNQGSGVLGAPLVTPVRYPNWATAGSIHVLDATRDGHADVVVSSYAGTSIIPGYGDGYLRQRVLRYPFASFNGAFGDPLVINDHDGDGVLDFVYWTRGLYNARNASCAP